MISDTLHVGDTGLSIHDEYSQFNTLSRGFTIGTGWIKEGSMSNCTSMVRYLKLLMEHNSNKPSPRTTESIDLKTMISVAS
jgi:hypothetical protein